MNLQPHTEKVFGEKQFLRNSVGLEYKTGGATLEADAFTDVAEDGYIKAGTAIYKNEDGFYVPWEDVEASEPEEDDDGEPAMIAAATGREGAGLTANDVKLIPGSHPIVGVLIAGHPLESKCTAVTNGFKEAVRGYLRFDA